MGILLTSRVPALRGVVRRVLPAHLDGDDAVQEALVRAIRSVDRLKQPERFDAWLAGIARNVAREMVRRRRFVSLASEPAAREGDSPDLEAAAHRRAWLAEQVSTLPPAQREALDLFYGEQLSYGAIAARLGITQAAVNRRLTKARNALREAKGGIDGSA